MMEHVPIVAGWLAALGGWFVIDRRVPDLWPGVEPDPASFDDRPGRKALAAVAAAAAAGAVWFAAGWISPVRALLWPYGDTVVTLLRMAALIPFAVLLAGSTSTLDALWIPARRGAARAAAATALAGAAVFVAAIAARVVSQPIPPAFPSPGPVLGIGVSVFLLDAITVLVLSRLAPASGLTAAAMITALAVSSVAALTPAIPSPVGTRLLTAAALTPLLALRLYVLGRSADLSWYAGVHLALGVTQASLAT